MPESIWLASVAVTASYLLGNSQDPGNGDFIDIGVDEEMETWFLHELLDSQGQK